MSDPKIDCITTERLTLKIVSPADAAAVLAYRTLNRPHLQAWEPQREESFYTLEAQEKQLTTWHNAFKEGQGYHWVIRLHDDDRVIGLCNFTMAVRGVLQSVHLGFSIGAEHQGKGLMYEALKSAISHMFEQEGFHRIMAYYIPRNARSRQLLTKLGFEREGYARQYVRINGQWEDHVLNSLINPADSQ